MQDNDTDTPSGRFAGFRELFLFLLLAVAIIMASLFTPVGEFFKMEHIEQGAQDMGPWGPSILVFAGLLTPLLFLPRWPIAFVSGLLYGVVWGTLLATVASTLGAMLHFALAKGLLSPMSDRLRKRYGITSAPVPRDKAFLVLVFLRAFPLSNFVATNLLAGAMKIHFGTYVVASFVGMIPSTLMFAAWGKLLKKPSPSFGVLAVATVLFIAIGTWVAKKRFYPWLKNLRSRDSSPDQPPP